jgi:predicted methyltransferase
VSNWGGRLLSRFRAPPPLQAPELPSPAPPNPEPALRGRIDLRAAINAVSDVVQNRPRPIRVFDQIHMKAGDMVMQSEIVADWSDGKRLAFIGDGDAISVCVTYLQAKGILTYGPRQVTVFDFDERTVNAVKRFAEKEGIPNLDARLYNVLDAMDPAADYDLFYTNPPWGASNNGESVNVFVERGMEATRCVGEGMVVIADDDELEWPKRVLFSVQQFAAKKGCYVTRMQRKLHEYHLDDAPDLKSCNLYLGALPGNSTTRSPSVAIDDAHRLENFYGRSKAPRVHYVKERKRLDYGVAHEDEFELVLLEKKGD